ncbi:MAG: HU family DNA-binding protein [Prevotella sp.]|nr:HU family DNA-binding protein [Prevotella sp.]
MNKTQLIAAVAENLSETKADTARFVNAVLGIIGETVQSEDVNIPDFGHFGVRTMPSRNGVNPATGERIVIPSHQKVFFRAADKMNGFKDTFTLSFTQRNRCKGNTIKRI